MENSFDNKSDNSNDIQNMLSMLDEHINFLNNRDLEGLISTIHSASPSQAPTRHMLGQLFATYRLKNELIDAKSIGIDEDYIYIRIEQKTTKIEGPEFRDNFSRSLIAAKKDGDAWKVWSTMPLDVTFCDEADAMNNVLM